jgi:hypothetical protein
MKCHTLKIVSEGFTNSVHPTVEMSISSEASLSDMLDMFGKFLQAVGYVLPENSVLDFVEE